MNKLIINRKKLMMNGFKININIKNKKFKLPDNKILIGSYHPSPRNVHIGRINVEKMVKLLKNIKKIMKDI